MNVFLESFSQIATGQVNKDHRHLTVPFYMPLQEPMELEDAMAICPAEITKAVQQGKVRLLAIATGMMNDRESSWPVQFVLLHGKTHDDDPNLYLTYECSEGEFSCAVLMDGDGCRVRDDADISQDQAVAYWMGGFLGWNDDCPGLYRLKYAFIKE